MDWQRAHQSGQAISRPAGGGRLFDARVLDPHGLSGERKQRGRRIVEIGVERRAVRHDPGLDIEAAGIDQAYDPLARDLAAT